MELLEYLLRHSVVAESQLTPFKITRGWAAATPGLRAIAPWTSLKELPASEWVRDLVASWTTIVAQFDRHLENYADDSKVRRDARLRPLSFKVGDEVFMEPPPNLRAPMFTTFGGPFKVAKVISQHSVVLEACVEGSEPRARTREGLRSRRRTVVLFHGWCVHRVLEEWQARLGTAEVEPHPMILVHAGGIWGPGGRQVFSSLPQRGRSGGNGAHCD
jgi:hypothetical protein